MRFDVPTQRLAFTGVHGRRIVEPGEITLWVGPSCAERETVAALVISGPVHTVTADDPRLARARVERQVTAPAV